MKWEKWDERSIEQPKFTTDHSSLFTNGHSDCPLLNPYFECWWFFLGKSCVGIFGQKGAQNEFT